MCTIALALGVHPQLPLVVAANRDEFYSRPSLPPAVISDRGPQRILAGRDRAHGGTWMGVTAGGFFVGLTNQRTYRRPTAGRRSRGEVAMALLAAGSRAGARDVLEQLAVADYASFNVLFGDADGVEVCYARAEESAGLRFERLDPGVWVLANDEMGSADFPKTERALALVNASIGEPWPSLSASLQRALADHETPPASRVPRPPTTSWVTRGLARRLQAICVHTPLYGTCSATILAAERGRVVHYLFADGPPCRTPFGDYVGALAAPP